jgi:hypothetical protein
MRQEPAVPEIVHATEASNLADVLERILDKGIVIAGDIRIRLVEVELLTINIRLLISSVDKAREMGIDWWSHNTFLTQPPRPVAPVMPAAVDMELQALRSRLDRLERPAVDQ